MPVNEEFKRLVDKIKYEFSINQAQISERLGVKSTYLSDMINGRVPYNESMQKKIYEIFHIKHEDSSGAQEGVNTIGDRISEVMYHFVGNERGNKAKFSRIVGENPNTVGNWLSRGDGIGKDVINKIITAYPNVNSNWLLTGEGDMLNSDVSSERSVDVREEGDGGLNSRELLDIIHDLTAQGKQNAEANERNSRNIEKLIGLLAESLKQERDERSGSRLDEKDSA